MRIHLSNWSGMHTVVSVAKSQYASDKLKDERISHWLITFDSIICWPGNQELIVSSDDLEQLQINVKRSRLLLLQ